MKDSICPVCGNPHLDYKSFMEPGIGIVEEYFSCSRCNYIYEFAYGAYRECFGKHEFIWSYSLYDNFNKLCRFDKHKDRYLFISRRNWKKGLRKGKF